MKARSTGRRLGEKWIQVGLFLLLSLCYTYTLPRWADPNQNSRLDMVVAVVEDGTFQIDEYVENTVDYAKVGEHYYGDEAPGVAFLGIPVYVVLKGILNRPIVDVVVKMPVHRLLKYVTRGRRGREIASWRELRAALGGVNSAVQETMSR